MLPGKTWAAPQVESSGSCYSMPNICFNHASAEYPNLAQELPGHICTKPNVVTIHRQFSPLHSSHISTALRVKRVTNTSFFNRGHTRIRVQAQRTKQPNNQEKFLMRCSLLLCETLQRAESPTIWQCHSLYPLSSTSFTKSRNSEGGLGVSYPLNGPLYPQLPSRSTIWATRMGELTKLCCKWVGIRQFRFK